MDDWIFRDAPEIDADIYLPADLYRRNAKGIAGYLFNGSMARESLLDTRPVDSRRWRTPSRADDRRAVQISDCDFDDLNAPSPKPTCPNLQCGAR